MAQFPMIVGNSFEHLDTYLIVLHYPQGDSSFDSTQSKEALLKALSSKEVESLRFNKDKALEFQQKRK